MTSDLALYVHDSLPTVPTTLLPLARAAYERHGVRGVLVGPGSERIDPSELCSGGTQFLEIHAYRRYEEFPGYRGGANAVPIVRWVREVAYWKRVAADLLDRYRPRAIFSTKRDHEDMLFLTKNAAAAGIPTVQVFWGLVASEAIHRRRRILNYDGVVAGRSSMVRAAYRWRGRFKSALSGPVYRGFGVGWHASPNRRRYSRFLALPNEAYRQLFIEDGLPERQLVVTGHPEDDLIRSYLDMYSDPAARAGARAELGLPRDATVAVYGNGLISNLRGMMSEDQDREIIRRVMAKVRDMGAFLVLKLHPRDDPDRYEWFREEFPDALLVRDCDFYKLIVVSDLFLSQGSTTTRWAVLAGVPTILIDFVGLDFMPYVTRLYGVSPVTSFKGFAERAKSALSGEMEPEMRMAYSVASGPAGDATDRILSLAGLAPGSHA